MNILNQDRCAADRAADKGHFQGSVLGAAAGAVPLTACWAGRILGRLSDEGWCVNYWSYVYLEGPEKPALGWVQGCGTTQCHCQSPTHSLMDLQVRTRPCSVHLYEATGTDMPADQDTSASQPPGTMFHEPRPNVRSCDATRAAKFRGLW